MKGQRKAWKSEKETTEHKHGRHKHVVDGDAHEHGKGVIVFVHAEGIALGDILFGHVHVVVAQYAAYKGFVVGGAQCADCYEQGEDKEGENGMPWYFLNKWQFKTPERKDAGSIFFLIAVDVLVKCRRPVR